MPSVNLKELFGTLRVRLTLWNTGVVLLMVLATLIGVREGLRLTLLHRLDVFLHEELFEIAFRIQRSFPRWPEIYEELDQEVREHPARPFFVQVFDPDGRLQYSSVHTPEDQDWVRRPLSQSDRVVVNGRYRLLQHRLELRGVPHLLIRVVSATDSVEHDIASLSQMMLAVGGVVLLLAPLGGYLLAGRATRPVARIINTAERLHPANLAARLPVRGTGDELDRVSVTINGLLDRIAAYLEQNREFTANAAHELRSPLTAFQNTLEVALEAERSPAEYRELLSDLLEECGYLRSLINQLLLLAENDSGRSLASAETLRLDQLVRRTLEMFQGVAEVGGVELTAPHVEPLLVNGDASRLRQVINNLIDNAIKFTAQGRVTVTLRRDEATGEGVLIVADTGSGIPLEDLPHIFERFYRADKSRQREPRRTRGTGLGLSICQSIVAAHGGTIRAASTPGKGSEFTVRLPNCRRPAAEPGATPAASEASSAS